MKENKIISLEMFKEIIKEVQESNENSLAFSKALEKHLCTSSYCYVDITNKIQETLTKVLYKVFNIDEKEDVLGWWLYEDVLKRYYYPDGFELKLETVEELYNYLVNHEKINKEHGRKPTLK